MVQWILFSQMILRLLKAKTVELCNQWRSEFISSDSSFKIFIHSPCKTLIKRDKWARESLLCGNRQIGHLLVWPKISNFLHHFHCESFIAEFQMSILCHLNLLLITEDFQWALFTFDIQLGYHFLAKYGRNETDKDLFLPFLENIFDT